VEGSSCDILCEALNNIYVGEHKVVSEKRRMLGYDPNAKTCSANINNYSSNAQFETRKIAENSN
jgi:GTP-sensing pleiotropic transcriptional regulator CodY